MAEKIKLLDHGYIQFIECWGSDERIVEAARMSTDKGFLGWEPGPCSTCNGSGTVHGSRPMGRDDLDAGVELISSACKDCEGKGTIRGDKFLLRYLWTEEPKHTTPFEMAGMIVEIQAPIMVYREWHRHRTQSYNEMSSRYTPLPDMNYIPSVERLMIGSDGKNKQAGTIKGAEVLTEATAKAFQTALKDMYKYQQQLYEQALGNGVPKELARVHLPVGRYSRMRASANLLNWLKFMTLRSHKKAQWEIRQYSHEVGRMIQEHFPRTYALFVEGKGEAYSGMPGVNQP